MIKRCYKAPVVVELKIEDVLTTSSELMDNVGGDPAGNDGWGDEDDLFEIGQEFDF